MDKEEKTVLLIIFGVLIGIPSLIAFCSWMDKPQQNSAKSEPEIPLWRYEELEREVRKTPEIKAFVLKKYVDGTISESDYKEINEEFVRLRADSERRQINELMLRLIELPSAEQEKK